MEIEEIIFILLILLGAYLAFRILTRTVKSAFRALMVLLIFAITIAGGLAIWNLDGFGLSKKFKITKKSH